MTDENKSLDILGLKGLSDSVRIATEGFRDGAAAFLSRVCVPALEEFGLALRDRVSAWRARNAAKILNSANNILNANQPGTKEQVHPRLVHFVMEEGSWIEDEQVQEMWAGLLASSTSHDGKSDENLIFLNILKQISSLQAQAITLSVERADKFIEGPNGLALPAAAELVFKVDELRRSLGCDDLDRLDRELDHMRSLGLIGYGLVGGGIRMGTDQVDLTPTALALNLYVRFQGSKLSPSEYWQLTRRSEGNA